MYEEILRKMMEAEQCFRKACGQIFVMNRVLQELQRRYDMASKQHMRAFRYSLRLRISVIEGVRNMFYAYANTKADLITDLRKELILSEEQYSDSEINSDFVDDESDYEFSDSDFPYSDYDEDGEFEEDDEFYGDKELDQSTTEDYRVSVSADDSARNIVDIPVSIDTSVLENTHEEDNCDV